MTHSPCANRLGIGTRGLLVGVFSALVLLAPAVGAEYEVITFRDGQVRSGHLDEKAGTMPLDDGSTIAVVIGDIVDREVKDPRKPPLPIAPRVQAPPSEVTAPRPAQDGKNPPPPATPAKTAPASTSEGSDPPTLALRLRKLQEARLMLMGLLIRAGASTPVPDDLYGLILVTNVELQLRREATAEALDEVRERYFPGSSALLRQRQEAERLAQAERDHLDAQVLAVFAHGVRRLTPSPALATAPMASDDRATIEERQRAHHLVNDLVAYGATPPPAAAGWVAGLLTDPERMALLAGFLAPGDLAFDSR